MDERAANWSITTTEKNERLSAVHEEVEVEMKPEVERMYRFVETQREIRRLNVLTSGDAH
jgi:hypothetical protein